MCHFITLVAPIDKADSLSEVMARHGRRAMPIENTYVSEQLQRHEQQYITTNSCDCGTILAPHRSVADLDRDLQDEMIKLKRKGWSAPKINRALEGRRDAGLRRLNSGPDSLALWAAVIGDLLNARGLRATTQKPP